MDYVKKYLNVEGVIGQGAFGRVLVTSPLQNQIQPNKLALKCVHPILRPQRLASELRYLRDLGGKHNVVQMHSAHFCAGSLFIVMELIEHDRFVDIVAQLDMSEILLYMKNLLIALQHVHSRNIMHRDIKPANFLFNRKNKKFLLVDFGLAQLVRTAPSTPKSKISSPSTPTTVPRLNAPLYKKLRFSNNETREPVTLFVGAYESPVTQNDTLSSRKRGHNHDHKFSTPTLPRRALGPRCDCRGKPRICSSCQSRPESTAPKSGTPGYKAVEILLRYHYQTTAIDIWSAGVIFACLLAGHTPFFRDVDDNISLAEIITVLGSQRVCQAARAMGIRLTVEPKREPINLKYLCTAIRSSNPDKNQISIADGAFNLLNQMLDPNPMTRITASAALQSLSLLMSETT